MSLALHTWPLLLLVNCSTPEPPKPPTGETQPQREIIFASIDSAGSQVCAAYYVGLGLMRAPGGRIIEVAVNGPAWQAGVQEGDVFVNHAEFEPNTRPEGSHFRMILEQGGRQTTRLVRVGKVCYA